MNATGLNALITNVSQTLGMPHVRAIVANGSVREDEFVGTRENLAAIEATLKRTPHQKLEALVTRFNPQLTAHYDTYHAELNRDPLKAFRDAQVLAGLVTSVLGKSGLH